jgi:hypothetical protein
MALGVLSILDFIQFLSFISFHVYIIKLNFMPLEKRNSSMF